MSKSSHTRDPSRSTWRTITWLLLVLLPLAIAAILGCAGFATLPVFKLDQNGLIYRISSKKYTTNNGAAPAKEEYAYAAPEHWPKPIHDVSLWLLFHMILAILLVVYVVVLLGSMALSQFRKDKYEAIVKPVWWTLLPAVLLAALSIGLGARDAVFWGQGGEGFGPTKSLGYAAVVGTMLLGVFWLAALAFARTLPRSPATKYTSDSYPQGKKRGYR